MLPLAFRFAARELRSGVAGFRIFLACLALGVAAIAAAGSTAEAFRHGLASEAATILGGDLAVGVQQRTFSPAEQALLARLGRVSYAAASRAMAQAPSGARRLVELRGVSQTYPLIGAVELKSGGRLDQALSPSGKGAVGVVVEQPLLDRLGLKLGEPFLIGNIPVAAKDVLVSEPDRLSRGFALGPRVLATLPTLGRGGFLAPGLPFGETARLMLRPGLSVHAAEAQLRSAFPAGGYYFRDRNDAAPGLSRLIDQLEYFLGFIGLASLIAGGLGVYGAVSAYLETRKTSIATLKALGAGGALVRNVYLVQIAVLAGLGVVIGLAVGAASPILLGALARQALPIPALFAVYPAPLERAGAFGLLSAAAFSLTPLALARASPPAMLFRRDVATRFRPGLELLGSALAAACLAGLAVTTAPDRTAAWIMLAGLAAAFVCLFALGLGAQAAAGAVRGLARGPVRIGLANLSARHSAARTAAPAIGLGVALLTTVTLVQSCLVAEVSVVAPKAAPALVFTDIPGDRAQAFDQAVAGSLGQPLTADRYLRAPYLTGRIVAVRGAPAAKARISQTARWGFDADISVSAIGPEPAAANLISGHWWPSGYTGPPLIALQDELARGAGLKVGDAVTLSLLGRRLEARIAAARKVDFGGFGPNFSIIIDPAALAGAQLRQVAIAKASPAEEARVTRALGEAFPYVNVISVREQLEAAADLFRRLAWAIRAAAAVAGLAGLLVLAGAIAARARARAKEAAVLKVLGAARAQILGAYAVEYGAVGLVAGLAGVALGAAAAWPLTVKVFEITWTVDWRSLAVLVGGALALGALGGLGAALHALSGRPAPVLRAA
jgi:putative ABC transport system permease protein